jgi:hypothetical protein
MDHPYTDGCMCRSCQDQRWVRLMNNPAAKRTQALRESGYRGLIDQDGHALTPEREAELRASGRTVFASLPVDTDDD